MTKSNLIKAGFQAYYSNEELPGDIDRCQLLNIDAVRDNGFLVTKLYFEFKSLKTI